MNDIYMNMHQLAGPDKLHDMNKNKVKNDREALKAVAKEMESIFAYNMIKAMRETTNTLSKNNLGGKIYMSLFDMELAKLLSERGLGLKDLLLKQLENSVK